MGSLFSNLCRKIPGKLHIRGEMRVTLHFRVLGFFPVTSTLVRDTCSITILHIRDNIFMFLQFLQLHDRS